MHSFLGYVHLVVYPIIRLSYFGGMIESVGMRSHHQRYRRSSDDIH
ncbi:MAG: hypothetical protein V7L04_01320 [Nostoc sp.]|nr:hypothetical protein [Nostoc sp. S13]